MRRHLTPLLLLTAFALTGCGVTGSLKTPPPLFGDENKGLPAEQSERANEEEAAESEEDLLDILDELND